MAFHHRSAQKPHISGTGLLPVHQTANGCVSDFRIRIRLFCQSIFKASTILTVRRLRRSARQMFCAVFCACALCHQSLLSMIHTPPRRTEMSAQLPLISLETEKCSLRVSVALRSGYLQPSSVTPRTVGSAEIREK